MKNRNLNGDENAQEPVLLKEWCSVDGPNIQVIMPADLLKSYLNLMITARGPAGNAGNDYVLIQAM